VAFADFRPVILVHWDLRPRFGIEIRVTPDGGDQIRRSDGGLFAESPTVQQFTDVSHLSGQSFLEVVLPVAVGDLPFET
jgi:hypothetical protein